jgi:sulfur-oxidizing protein SoxY
MNSNHRVVSRRQAIALAGSVLAAPYLLRSASAQGAPWWQAIDAARSVIGTATPSTSGIAIDLPFISEDGSSVALGLSVDRPMTNEAYVESLHFFAPGNPSPEVVDFFFSPLSGRAAIATRIRLNQTQTVGAVARMSTGEVIVGEREIRITISGCLTRAETYAATDLMLTRVRVPEGLAAGTPGEVTTIINHPMETGLRADAAGNILPQNIIQRFLASFNLATVFEARLHRAVAANPYFRFFVAPPASGELYLRWEEDRGRFSEERRPITVA